MRKQLRETHGVKLWPVFVHMHVYTHTHIHGEGEKEGGRETMNLLNIVSSGSPDFRSLKVSAPSLPKQGGNCFTALS